MFLYIYFMGCLDGLNTTVKIVEMFQKIGALTLHLVNGTGFVVAMRPAVVKFQRQQLSFCTGMYYYTQGTASFCFEVVC